MYAFTGHTSIVDDILLTVHRLICSSWYCFISILSLAIVARQNNYVRPILTEDSILEIHNGRSVFIIVDLNLAWQLAIAFSFTYVYNLDLLQSHLDMLCRKWLLIPLFQMIPKFVMQVNSTWEIYKPSFLRHLELLQNFWHKIFYLGRINIVTGPNYSGKSIYIKQVIYFYNTFFYDKHKL